MTPSQPTATVREQMQKALKTINIVDELIHSITRRHIPDYPEATIAINKIDQLLAAETKRVAIEAQANGEQLSYQVAHDILADKRIPRYIALETFEDKLAQLKVTLNKLDNGSK